MTSHQLVTFLSPVKVAQVSILESLTSNMSFYLRRFSESTSSSGSTLFIHPSILQFFGCLVCVICNSKSFHSFLFKFCIIVIFHILKMCTSNFVHISWIFFNFWEVLNLDIFPFKMLRWWMDCVICCSESFHYSIFKLCIMIVHTLKMCTFNFVHIW